MNKNYILEIVLIQFLKTFISSTLFISLSSAFATARTSEDAINANSSTTAMQRQDFSEAFR